MSFEKPPIPSAEADQEKLDNEHQDAKEAKNTLRFFEEAIASLEGLTPAQKDAIRHHIQTEPGQWREVDGQDVTLVEIWIENGKVKFTISLYGMDVDDEIPLLPS